ncbi:alpha/beta hydrolase [Halovulum sp. GXIMD14794]
MQDREPERRSHWRISPPGMLLAALFFAASLTPSLIPRPPEWQGALSGISAGIGYAIGAALGWVWLFMRLPEGNPRIRRAAQRLMFAAALVTVVLAMLAAPDWQNATRRAIDAPPVETGDRVLILLIALAVFAVLWLAGTVFVVLADRAGRALRRVLPGRVGPVLGVVLAAYVFWAAIDGVLVRRAFEIADASFEATDALIAPEQVKPTDPMMTGSDASLIDWDAMGNKGRDFITRTPDPAEIAAFTGEEATRPVRVYVGRRSADTARERAELALAELIRTGGFERELLIVTTPVGTGWMDPGSHDVIDFMFGGDTAHVAAQYSYLTSVLSILAEVEYGLEQAEALFDVIYDHWSALPEDDRPKLYFHGLSQGAMNSQYTLPFLDTLGDPFDGAFWAGSPFLSPIWSYVRRNRNPDSPAWRPTYGNGSLIRVTNQQNVLEDAASPWGPIRFVMLNYGSDPIVVFDSATIWRPPAWLTEEPRAPDVAPEMRWYPFVTAFQVGLDMIVALGFEGYGHFYYYADYIDAWAALTDPEGWSDARADELREVFAARPPPW